MKKLFVLLFLLEPAPAPQTRPIPSVPLTVAVRTGSTHATLVWIDSKGVSHKERITEAAYAAIPNAGAPPMPATFTGTQRQWSDTWTNGLAYAAGGRPTLTTPSGEPVMGTSERVPATGRVTLYTGDDIDVGVAPSVTLESTQYTGTFPAISTVAARCGIVVIAGVIQAGTLNETCARNSSRR